LPLPEDADEHDAEVANMVRSGAANCTVRSP
jgi:hypothetical protein